MTRTKQSNVGHVDLWTALSVDVYCTKRHGSGCLVGYSVVGLLLQDQLGGETWKCLVCGWWNLFLLLFHCVRRCCGRKQFMSQVDLLLQLLRIGWDCLEIARTNGCMEAYAISEQIELRRSPGVSLSVWNSAWCWCDHEHPCFWSPIGLWTISWTPPQLRLSKYVVLLDYQFMRRRESVEQTIRWLDDP